MLYARLNLESLVILVVIAFRQNFLACGPHNDGVLILRNVRSNFVDEWGIRLNDTDITQIFQCSEIFLLLPSFTIDSKRATIIPFEPSAAKCERTKCLVDMV